MAKYVFPVEPIRPGYDIEFRLQFPQDLWDGEEIGSGRLVAQFRAAVPGPVLFEADTANATLQREAPRTLAFFLSDEATRPMDASTIVVFDIARIDGADRHIVLDKVIWPVLKTVTRDVA
ncbi:hypothetical protein [Mesorhizobium sp.]|uniref:hypothetical protein n=1 Tax=Mesorhizobium sp. TaxID=1871066 RepID=UPI000FD55CF2|nr:hypothetical protein [Mesorhizobium sp.]RUV98324.1 hypothetical protein EOA88_00355 [Mesorhizobium sp. M5C.F.Ca.IN.020.14.1.1]RWI99133.1 MAG: hypothetical protein EOR23_33855 [Mesorhizobium sp.]